MYLRSNTTWCRNKYMHGFFNDHHDKGFQAPFLQLVWKTFCRNYVKRKYPVNPQDADELPVFQYPVGSAADRRVYVWGLAEHGALGNQLEVKNMKKPPKYLHRPCRLTFAEQNKITDVACGYGFTIFSVSTTAKYKVFGTGINTDSQIGYHAPRRGNPLELVLAPAPISIPFKNEATKVTQLAAGRAHSLVLTDNEGVFTLGNNAYGQCGRSIVDNEEYFGSHVVHNIKHLDGERITSIACGQDHSLFVTDRGSVFACGWGADGQTGVGKYGIQCHPERIKGDIEGERIVKVSSIADVVLAVNDKGEVFGWGNSEYGQLLTKADTQQLNEPRHLPCPGLGKIVDIAAGGTFCIAVNDHGAVYVWGFGILGKGPVVDRSKSPTVIPETLFGKNEFQPDSEVVKVSSGISHLAAITNYGDLYMWGRNRGGCLGLGHVNDQFFPIKVAVGSQVKKISCGVDHTIALCQSFINK